MKNRDIILGGFFLILTSCGSVTKNKTSTDKESETDTRTETLSSNSLQSFSLEPVDLSKPITFGGKSYENTKIVYLNSNTDTKVKEEKKENAKEVIEVKDKKQDESSMSKWLPIIVIAVLSFVCFIILLIVAFVMWKINNKIK
jgi:small neutral amino acid transporter SnatA (MarC family)